MKARYPREKRKAQTGSAMLIDWRLCFIADSEAASGRDILQLIAEAVDGGATIVQLRGKKWTSREFLDVGMKAVRFLGPKKIPLIVNDRVDIALACEADGVHLGQDDMPLPYAREILGKNRIIGISVANLPDVISAGADGVAVISAIASAANPKKAAIEIIESIGKLKNRAR